MRFNKNMPIAIYLEGCFDKPEGKMGHGILRFSDNPVVCVIDWECFMATMNA